MFRKTASIFASAIVACGAFVVNAAGFDGKTLVTNDWFDASFTALTASDTAIAQGDTTGLGGSGSWTVVPATGVAKIAADADAGGADTFLAVDAPGEELTFSPTNLAVVSGMETSSFDVKSDAIDTLPEISGDAQAAFAVLDDGTTVSAMGYVAGGWTNLEYAAGADTLTNVWFTLYLDFATVSNVRYVRFSVQPDSGSLAVLADASGTTWFQAASNATTVASVSFSGVGSCRSFTGDSLEEAIGYVWTGAAGDDLWATPGNWTFGGVVATAAPGAGDNASIDGDVSVVVANGQNVGNLTLSGGAALVGPGPYEVSVSGGVVALSRVPSTFVWTNAGVSNWETLENWAVDGRATDVLPGGNDEVQFPASLGNGAFVKYSTSQTVSNAVFDAEVTLRIVGTRHDYRLYANEISGAGKLVLTNAAIGARGVVSGNTNYQTNLTVNVDVEVAPASTNGFFCNVGNIIMNGNLSGSGCVEASIYKQSFGPQFNGDNDNFTGEFWTTVNTGARRDFTQFADGGATSSNASWRVIGSDGNKAFFAKNNETYYFGALNGTVDNSSGTGNGYVNGCWAEVGALNIDCAFGGHYSRGYGSSGKPNDPHINHIRKVGTAKLTLTLSRPVGDIEIMGGTLVIGSQNSVPLYHTDTYQHYLKFLGDGATLAVSGTVTENEVTTFVDPSARIGYSTYPITFSNAVGEVHTWSTALAAQTADPETGKDGGLVKKGEGTLTLAAAPLYTGDTYLDGGVLKIPTSADKTVKTHLEGMTVRTATETIGEVEYTVYTLDKKRPMMILVF